MNNPKNRKIQSIWYDSQSYKNYIAQLEAEQKQIDESKKPNPNNLIKRIYNMDSGLITPVLFIISLMERWNTKGDTGILVPSFSFINQEIPNTFIYGDIGDKPTATVNERPWHCMLINPATSNMSSSAEIKEETIDDIVNKYLSVSHSLLATVNSGATFIEVSTSGTLGGTNNALSRFIGYFKNYPIITSSKIFTTDLTCTPIPSHIFYSGGGVDPLDAYAYPKITINIRILESESSPNTGLYKITYWQNSSFVPGITYESETYTEIVKDNRALSSLTSPITADVWTHITERFPDLNKIYSMEFIFDIAFLGASAYGYPGITGGATAGSIEVERLDNMGLTTN